MAGKPQHLASVERQKRSFGFLSLKQLFRTGVLLSAIGLVGMVGTTSCESASAQAEPQGRIGSSISPDGVSVRRASSMKSRSAYAAMTDSGNPVSLCDEEDPLQVLFVGNSYTFYNDMPAMVAQIAGSAGCQMEVTWATNGGYLLELHAQDPLTLATINERPWDFVVLQNQSQQPAYLPEHVEEHSLPVVKDLADEIYANNPRSEIVYYTTWGRRDGDRLNCAYNSQVCTFEGHTEALETGYSLYAEATDGRLARVGRAFSAVSSDAQAPFEPSDLYDPDGTHPSERGSYLAAAVFFYELTGVSPEGLAFPSHLTAHEAAYLQQIAAYTVEGRELTEPGGSVQSREAVVARCDTTQCDPAEGFDGAAATVTLFEGTCSDWYLRTNITELAQASTKMACGEHSCSTGAVNAWTRPHARELPEGTYSVLVNIDLDASGGSSPGDLEGCENSALHVGASRPQTAVVERFLSFDEWS